MVPKRDYFGLLLLFRAHALDNYAYCTPGTAPCTPRRIKPLTAAGERVSLIPHPLTSRETTATTPAEEKKKEGQEDGGGSSRPL